MMFPEIDTPAVLVDLDIAEANIDRFQTHCEQHGIRLRPHIKTHKLPRLARRQIAAGAIGITCQKISEAEAMLAEGGVSDVLLTYNVLGAAKLARLRALATRVRLTVVCDNEVVAEGLSDAFGSGRMALDVLVECDTGAGRCGVKTAAEVVAIAQAAAASIVATETPTVRAGDSRPASRADTAEPAIIASTVGMKNQPKPVSGSPRCWIRNTGADST